MKIIKLNAIDSTNSFLKELAITSALENYTVVIAKKQTLGRGQLGSNWFSESGKSLTFSVFVSFNDLEIHQKKYLNFAVSLSVYNTLLTYKIPKLKIKWPNDILSANKKLCGILIENVIKGKIISSSVIGIGLNVNQEKFSSQIKNATSIYNCLNLKIDLDILLKDIILELKKNIQLLNLKKLDDLENEYLSSLYKLNIPTMFKDCRNKNFMGIIKNISPEGKLQIMLEDNSIKEFGIKEVSFA